MEGLHRRALAATAVLTARSSRWLQRTIMSSLLFLAMLAVVCGYTLAEAEDATKDVIRTVKPETSTAVLFNPGKGWVLYGMPDWHRHGSLRYGSIGYRRFSWSQIEPEEGKCNFEPIDEFLAAWHEAGKQAAFGVMNANIHYKGKYVTPKWVFDAGCPARQVQQKRPKQHKDVAAGHRYEGAQVIPANWIDPVFLQKLESFLSALAGRYDGDPRLAWYEIRSYGNWGEGHLYPWRGEAPTTEQIFNHHIQLHRKLFTKSLLMAAWHYFEPPEMRRRAAELGVGTRDDGVMSFRDGSTTAVCDGLALSCFEWGGSYEQFTSEGLWTKPGRRLEDCIRNGRVYYCGFSRHDTKDIKLFLDNEQPLIDRVTNLLGYHLVIQEARLPRTIRSDVPFPLGLTWRNDGVARIWFACSADVALLDEQDRVVARRRLEGSHVAHCAGGETADDDLTATFAKVPPGEYRFAVGLCRSQSARSPDVRLGLKDVTSDGWHPLAAVTVQPAPASQKADDPAPR